MRESKYDKYVDVLLGYLFIFGVLQLIILVLFFNNMNYSKNDRVKVEIYEINEEEEQQKIEEEIEEAESQQAMYLEEIASLDKYTDREEWFINYKLVNLKYDKLGMPDTLFDMFSMEDIEYLYRCVETECHGADFESKAHVANVILNRVDSDIFPNTIKGVVTQPGQLSYGRTGINNSTKLACEYAFMIGTDIDDCLFFHSGNKTQKFNGATYFMTDLCGHHFYRLTEEVNK